MRGSHLYFAFILTFLAAYTLAFQVEAAPAGPLIKHLSALLKWTTRSSSKTPLSDGNVLQFEDGYLVETVVEGNEIGVVPYKIRVSEDGELFAVDEINSNIVKITPPLSQYSRGRLVAGSFQGYTGHVDGKPSEARFNHPKGVTMDDKGNVYVADTSNLAIRKIGDKGVTTIAGGKSNVAGYRDGPSEDAKFSNDFDVVYIHSTCSLLVVDRGNAALRQISLNQEDCDYQSSYISVTDILMVIGAVVGGYIMCLIQHGFSPSIVSRVSSEGEYQEQPIKPKPTPVAESVKEEPKWPSFGQLVIDLSKLALEALGSVLLYFIPSWFRSRGARKGLTPLKDSLRMPEDDAVHPPSTQKLSTNASWFGSSGIKKGFTPLKDSLRMPGDDAADPPSSQKLSTNASWFGSSGAKKGLTPLKDSLRMPEDDVAEPPTTQRQSARASTQENRQASTPNVSERYSDVKPPKIRSASFKDPSLSSKHKSSKRQDYAEFYAPGEVNSYARSKSHKEKTRHRQRDKSGEAAIATVAAESKPVGVKPVDYDNPKFEHYGMRSKYGADNSYRY